MATQNLCEYHLCVDDCSEFDSLISFIHSLPEAVYSQHCYECTPQRGAHIHASLYFTKKPKAIDDKSLERHRKSLNFWKKTDTLHPKGLGWYLMPASKEKNLSYIMKPETKVAGKPNVEWYSEHVTDEQREDIDSYLAIATGKVVQHAASKNGDALKIICYIDEIEKPKYHSDDDCWKTALRGHLPIFIVNYFRYNDSWCPTPNNFQRVLLYLRRHYGLLTAYEEARELISYASTAHGMELYEEPAAHIPKPTEDYIDSDEEIHIDDCFIN